MNRIAIDPEKAHQIAIKYLLWDNTPSPRFETFEDFLAWGLELGMDFSELRLAFDMVKSTYQEQTS